MVICVGVEGRFGAYRDQSMRGYFSLVLGWFRVRSRNCLGGGLLGLRWILVNVMEWCGCCPGTWACGVGKPNVGMPEVTGTLLPRASKVPQFARAFFGCVLRTRSRSTNDSFSDICTRSQHKPRPPVALFLALLWRSRENRVKHRPQPSWNWIGCKQGKSSSELSTVGLLCLLASSPGLKRATHALGPELGAQFWLQAV